MTKLKPIDDPQFRDKNAVAELRESRDKHAKSHIINLDRVEQIKQVKEWLEKVRKL